MIRTLSVNTDDAGSLSMALMLTMVGVLLSAVLASTVSVQITSARSALQGQRELDAAQAGLDIVVGHIRAGDDGTGNAAANALPCGPFSGAVGAGGRATYLVSIVYRTVGGTAIPCSSPFSAPVAPVTADLTSKGTDVTASRTVQATYTFRSANNNIPGGLIHNHFPPAGVDECFDAGSGNPAPGTPVKVQTCTTGLAAQTFAYNTDLTISLVSSRSDLNPYGLCLDGGMPHVDLAPITMQACTAVAASRQRWSEGPGTFSGTSNGTSTDNYFIYVAQPNTPGSPLRLAATSTGYSSIHQFDPDAFVGAGAAGVSSGQVVNYAQFGRCLDVTGGNWQATYQIAYYCHQAFTPAGLSWNQVWVLPTAISDDTTRSDGVISLQPNNTAFRACLTTVNTSGGYPVLSQCPASGAAIPASMQWTHYGDTGTYQTSYTLVDSNNRCLAATSIPFGSTSIATIVVESCTEATRMKWNGDPYVLKASPLSNILEK